MLVNSKVGGLALGARLESLLWATGRGGSLVGFVIEISIISVSNGFSILCISFSTVLTLVTSTPDGLSVTTVDSKSESEKIRGLYGSMPVAKNP